MGRHRLTSVRGRGPGWACDRIPEALPRSLEGALEFNTDVFPGVILGQLFFESMTWWLTEPVLLVDNELPSDGSAAIERMQQSETARWGGFVVNNSVRPRQVLQTGRPRIGLVR
jgi:hypothetical protein